VSDIVDRLREVAAAAPKLVPEAAEAADEIERLRNQLDAARTGKALLALEAERALCDQLAEALRDRGGWDQIRSGYGLGGPDNPDLPWAQQTIADALDAYEAARNG
jgi:hypothetical protein